MKELSIEEKAKAYDDLLVKLQKAKVDNDVCDERYCCVIDSIVPELKDSEDERVRNFISNELACLRATDEKGTVRYNELTEAIAWLEKQGEQEPAEKKELKKDEKEIEISFGAYDSELQEDTYFIPKGFHIEINDDKVVIKKGEKPNVWSEEDEYLLGKTIQCLEEFIRIAKYCGIDVQSYQRDIDWVKSLKNRVGCETNCTITKEWSEDDEQYLLVCKNALRKYERTDKWDASIISHWLENKLKSVNPQNTWMPSDEQLDALQYVYRNYNPPISDNLGWDSIRALEMMYRDLKKLKG